MEKFFEQPKIMETEIETEKEKEPIQFIEAALDKEAEMMETVAGEITLEKKQRFFKKLTPLIFATTFLGLLSIGSFRKMSFSEAWAQEVPGQEEVAKEKEVSRFETVMLRTPEEIESWPAELRVALLNPTKKWLKIEGLMGGLIRKKEFWLPAAEEKAGQVVPSKAFLGLPRFGEHEFDVIAYEKGQKKEIKDETDQVKEIKVEGEGKLTHKKNRRIILDGRTKKVAWRELDPNYKGEEVFQVGDRIDFRERDFPYDKDTASPFYTHKKVGPFEFEFPVRRGGGRYVKDRGRHWYPGGGRR